MLKRAAKRIFNLVLHKPLSPASDTERQHLLELKQAFRALPPPEVQEASQSQAECPSNTNQLREPAFTLSPREFLRRDEVANSGSPDHEGVRFCCSAFGNDAGASPFPGSFKSGGIAGVLVRIGIADLELQHLFFGNT